MTHKLAQYVEFKWTLLDGYHDQAVAPSENTQFAKCPLNKWAVDNSMTTRQLALGHGFTLGYSLSATALLFNTFLANFVFSDGATAWS